MKYVRSITALVAVVFVLRLAGCNNANIPDEGRLMKDADGNEYLVTFHCGNVYTIDPLPTRSE